MRRQANIMVFILMLLLSVTGALAASPQTGLSPEKKKELRKNDAEAMANRAAAIVANPDPTPSPVASQSPRPMRLCLHPRRCWLSRNRKSWNSNHQRRYWQAPMCRLQHLTPPRRPRAFHYSSLFCYSA
jgi:hypothetical protein